MKVTPGWPCTLMASASGKVSIWPLASSTICFTVFLILSGIATSSDAYCTNGSRSETIDFEFRTRKSELRQAFLEIVASSGSPSR